MKEIYIIRHGESESNVASELSSTLSDWDIPLTENGHKQSEEVGKTIFNLIHKNITIPNSSLRPIFYISPYLRTTQTFYGIMKEFKKNHCHVSMYFDERLREIELGDADGKWTKQAFKSLRTQKNHNSFWYRYNGGESGADVALRTRSFLSEFETKKITDPIIIVGHGYSLRILLYCLFGWSVEYFNTTKKMKNCEWNKIYFENGIPKLEFPIKTRE
jgi:2,3-bisphosphoglycerate-dependent phosphoglycerate mutase